MISIITHGRNDNWQGTDWNGKTYLDSVYESMSKNLEIIEKIGVPYEYILVEWGPFNDLIMTLPRFKELFEKYQNLRTIVVDESVIVADGLKPRQYFEFFAKNVGIRQCKYENVIMTNTDIIIYPKTMRKFVELAKAGLDDSLVYRVIWRFHGAGPHPQEQTGRIQNNEARLLVMPGGAFPGDLHMTTKKGYAIYGKGYNETNDAHKTLAHTGMDSEFIMNWEHNGGKCEWLDESYWHINHHHPNPYDKGYFPVPYENRENWGYADCPVVVINNQLSKLIKK